MHKANYTRNNFNDILKVRKAPPNSIWLKIGEVMQKYKKENWSEDNNRAIIRYDMEEE